MAGHDVFISYSSKDQLAANAVCHGLEARSIKCWMAPRDQMAGRPYGEQITEAIQNAKVMVLVFSDHVNASRAVHNEVDLAAGANVTIVPFRITGAVFNSELRFYLGRVHWLDAFPQPVENYIDNLAETVRRNLISPQPEFTGENPPPLSEDGPAPDLIRPPQTKDPILPPPPPPPPRTGNNTQLYMILGGLGGVLLLTIVLVMTVLGSNRNETGPGINTTFVNAAVTPQPPENQLPPPGPQRVAFFENLTVQGGPPAQLEGIRRINTQEMAQIVANRAAVILDARGCTSEPIIPGSICIGGAHVSTLLQQMTPQTPLAIYCHDGACGLSAQMAVAARQAGFTAVYWYRGGIHAWQAAGYQTLTYAQQQQMQQQPAAQAPPANPQQMAPPQPEPMDGGPVD